MSMKEIKVCIIGQPGPGKVLLQTTEPNLSLDRAKTYKLVEDEPSYIDTDSLYKTTLKMLLNSRYGLAGKHPIELLNLTQKQELLNLLEKTPVKIQTDSIYGVFGERGGGKTIARILNNINNLPPIDELKGSPRRPKRVLFNDNATILEIGDFKAVVKRDEKDKFSYYIGLGLALSRYYEKRPATKIEIKYLKDELHYKKLAHYCLHKYFGFDTKRVDKFLKSCEKNKWVELNV